MEMRAVFAVLLFMATTGLDSALRAEDSLTFHSILRSVLCSSKVGMMFYLNQPTTEQLPEGCVHVEDETFGLVIEQIEYDGPRASATIIRYKTFFSGDKFGYTDFVLKVGA